MITPNSIRWTVTIDDDTYARVIQFASIRIYRVYGDMNVITGEQISEDTLTEAEVAVIRNTDGSQMLAYDSNEPIAESGFWSNKQFLDYLSR